MHVVLVSQVPEQGVGRPERVVDEDVDPSETFDRGVHRRLRLRRVLDIDLDRQCRAAGRLDRPDRLLRTVEVDVCDDDARAGP